MLVTATCLPHVRLIQDAVSPTVTLFVQELLGDALPAKYWSLFSSSSGFLFLIVTPLTTGGVWKRDSSGALQVWSGWEDLLGAIVNRVLVESLGYERNANRNNYTVELRTGAWVL